MYTIIKTKYNKLINYRTQQYLTGTYIIINNDPTTQHGSKLDEKNYHIKLRRDNIKNSNLIYDGDKIKDYKGRYKINKFVK